MAGGGAHLRGRAVLAELRSGSARQPEPDHQLPDQRPLTGNDAVRADLLSEPSGHEHGGERCGRERWIGRTAVSGPRRPARPGPERPEAAGSRQNAVAMAAGKVAG